ncbi:magnesium-transporting ATPase (P-type) [Paenibacillus sp. DS2015]|uniref:DNA-directed RNA polymerase subunit beta n=1 Tax=Paenibacillus sp. DS2015 TaxID=3373917 RepID=UPI003D2485D5
MSKENKPPKRKTATWRIVFRWMIPLFLFLSLIGGMMVGYVVLGKEEMSEVFQLETWEHVMDLIFAP